MRLRTFFFAAPLLLAGAVAARGQAQFHTPASEVPYDSRTSLPLHLEPAKVPAAGLTVVPAETIMLKRRIARRETCYAMRGYDYSADADGSGNVRPQGSSTCQLASQYHLKSASGR